MKQFKTNLTFLVLFTFLFTQNIYLFGEVPIDSINLKYVDKLNLDTNYKIVDAKIVENTLFLKKPIYDSECKLYKKGESTEKIVWIFTIIASLVIGLAIYLCFWQYMLKDVIISDKDTKLKKYKSLNISQLVYLADKKQYSLSRCIGMWWTMIIVICSIFGASQNHGTFIAINSTCLILLGIGAGTTVLGNLIDYSDINSGKMIPNRHQDLEKHRNFWWDILNDGNNYSIHRFQALVFNVIFGVVFSIEFYQNLQIFIGAEPSENPLNSCQLFPTFDPFTLGLLGVSSSIYLTVKTTENKTKDTSESNSSSINPNTNEELKTRVQQKIKETLPK